jgi:hypothetical protein
MNQRSTFSARSLSLSRRAPTRHTAISSSNSSLSVV